MGVRCPRCGEVKSREEFFKNSANKNGLHTYCKLCAKAYDKEKYPGGKPRARSRYLENTYGLTVNEWSELFDSQGGVCAICGEVPDRAVVDHCHGTGQVRGILCNNCNRCLGLLKDDVDVLTSAVAYLMQYQKVGV